MAAGVVCVSGERVVPSRRVVPSAVFGVRPGSGTTALVGATGGIVPAAPEGVVGKVPGSLSTLVVVPVVLSGELLPAASAAPATVVVAVATDVSVSCVDEPAVPPVPAAVVAMVPGLRLLLVVVVPNEPSAVLVVKVPGSLLVVVVVMTTDVSGDVPPVLVVVKVLGSSRLLVAVDPSGSAAGTTLVETGAKLVVEDVMMEVTVRVNVVEGPVCVSVDVEV